MKCQECRKHSSTICWWPEKRKLVFLREKATPDFWDRQWHTDEWEKQITHSRKSRRRLRLLQEYLPDKNSRILEGGCGSGHIVDAMTYWGYKAFGVDFARETVARIKEVAPNLDVRYGDVRSLEFEDEFFDGYWSLGVIEHLWQGYEDVINEMHRVLKVGGYAFVGFPAITKLDRLKIHVRGYKRFSGNAMPDSFYQFALDVRSVRKDFRRSGFQCVRTVHMHPRLGLTRIFPWFERLDSALIRLSKKSIIIRAMVWGIDLVLAPLCGHSVRLIMKKC